MSTRDKYEYGAAPAEDEERMEWNTLAAQLEASDVHVPTLRADSRSSTALPSAYHRVLDVDPPTEAMLPSSRAGSPALSELLLEKRQADAETSSIRRALSPFSSRLSRREEPEERRRRHSSAKSASVRSAEAREPKTSSKLRDMLSIDGVGDGLDVGDHEMGGRTSWRMRKKTLLIVGATAAGVLVIAAVVIVCVVLLL